MGNSMSCCNDADVAEQSTNTTDSRIDASIEAFDGALDPETKDVREMATAETTTDEETIRPVTMDMGTPTTTSYHHHHHPCIGEQSPEEGDDVEHGSLPTTHHPAGVPLCIPDLLEAARETRPPLTMEPSFAGLVNMDLLSDGGDTSMPNPLQHFVSRTRSDDSRLRERVQQRPYGTADMASSATAGPPSLAATTGPVDPQSVNVLGVTSADG